MPLDVLVAAALKIDGPPGFFLANEWDDAAFFAVRRGQGTVIEVLVSASAIAQLLTAGAVRQPIPVGLVVTFAGDEVLVPPHLFDLFNRLRATGEIRFVPARKP